MRAMSKKAKAEQFDSTSAELNLTRKAMADFVRGPDARDAAGHYTVYVVGCWRMERGGTPSVVVVFHPPCNGLPDVSAYDASDWYRNMMRQASDAICSSDDKAYRHEWECMRSLCGFVRDTVNAAYKAQGNDSVFIS